MPWQVIDRGDGSEAVWVEEDPVASFTSQMTGTAPAGSSNEVRSEVANTASTSGRSRMTDAEWNEMMQAFYAANKGGGESLIAYMPTIAAARMGVTPPGVNVSGYQNITPEQFGRFTDPATYRTTTPITDAARRNTIYEIGPEAYELAYGRDAVTPEKLPTVQEAVAAGKPEMYISWLTNPTTQSFYKERGLTPERQTDWERYLNQTSSATGTTSMASSGATGTGGVSSLPTLESLFRKYQADIAAGIPSNVAAQPIIEFLNRRGG